jgi:hypothetical protein
MAVLLDISWQEEVIKLGVLPVPIHRGLKGSRERSAIHEDILKKHDLNKDRSFIEAEIRRALDMRAKKHDGMTTSYCAPTIGKMRNEKL